MQIKKYNVVNDLMGWFAFLVAAITYLLTVEPTASFWDCPEFISQGAKLEVGHPPGNPIFMLAARFFVTLFGGGMDTAALAVNCMSALLSAGTILLLFWSVTHLTRRLIVSDQADSISMWQLAVIMGSGLCAALAYTWSDTFWFSAVEGEVYAFSSFCTALVFWLMLKWENRADEPYSDRYLILIAYVIGVSIAVHLLNLLCIPALGLIFYYRKWKDVNAVGSLIALGISCVIVGAILYGLVPGFVQVAQWFELMFINGFGMSYNMGVLIYAIILVAVFVLTIRALYRSNNGGYIRTMVLLSVALSGMPFIGHSVWVGVLVILALAVYLFGFCRPLPVRVLSIAVISIFVIFIGYSSYALLLIRASANTPMNQNAPDNVFALASYLNREQYGDRPLFKGPVFAETFDEMEYPQGSGEYYVPVDEYGRPKTRVIDGYLRDERGGAFNTPSYSYTKVVKTSPDQPDEYVDEVERPSYRTMPDLDMFFTRIYGNDPEGRFVAGYKSWAGYNTPDIYSIPQEVRGRWAQQGFVPKYELLPYLHNMTTVVTNVDSTTGEPLLENAVWKPGFDVNLRYFINYQLNHMYWRYFMWNFAGRQNDLQGNGEPHLGNWISGIPAIDNARLGDQSLLPDEYGKANKGHNVFYMMPLILGIIGLLYQALYRHRHNHERGIQQFWVVFFLFFMTGIAIVLYLNQTPGQPRERDYAFAGSFYAFAIWIGMGVPAIAQLLRNLLQGKASDDDKKGHTAAVVSATVACAIGLAVPLQMVSQTWDDHDRSGRYTTRDFGFNYLSSLAPNAVIFTNGDNDTFPLWYAQEVEGYRTDVRVVNLSYLTTDWYANQLKHPSYNAAAVDMYAQPKDYAYERLGYSFVVPQDRELTDARTALQELYASDDELYGAPFLTRPNVYMPVDSAAAMAAFSTGTPMIDSLYLAPYLANVQTDLSALGSGMNQGRTLSLDIVANSVAGGWKRPTYFATTVPSTFYLGLTPFLSATGLAYQVTPFANPEVSATAETGYRNVVGEYRWGGLDGENPGSLYLDETVRRMVASVRSAILTIAEDLMSTGNLPASEQSRQTAVKAGLEAPATYNDMARQLLDIIRTKLPAEASPLDGMLGLYMSRDYLDLYLASGNKADLDMAEALATAEAERYAQFVRYGSALSPADFAALGRPETYAMQYLGEAVALKNRIDILRAKPEIATDPAYADALGAIAAGLETDLRIAPLIYVEGYKAEELERELETFAESQRPVLRAAIAMLGANAAAGVDPMAYSRDLMTRHGLTAAQWQQVLR